jgi:HSP20 family protein
MSRHKKKKMREREERAKSGEEKEPKGAASSILQELGDTIPGLGGLIKGLGKLDAFQERLKAIDKEVEAKLSSEPLKRVEGEGRGRWPRSPASIPRRTGATVRGDEHIRRVQPEAGLKEFLVDVFNEEDHVKIIAEMPGVKENDIKIDLSGDKLIISADTLNRHYYQALNLPCMPKGLQKIAYKNGILVIRLEKYAGTG